MWMHRDLFSTLIIITHIVPQLKEKEIKENENISFRRFAHWEIS